MLRGLIRLARMQLVDIADRLVHRLDSLGFSPPVTHVYNPLDYARVPHARYLERYGSTPKEVLLVGMNPGPFGMMQTGVPFGAVPWVRDWMGIEAPVRTPKTWHPKRPIEGFACKRVEVSGDRLWGWAKASHGTAERFFKRFFVYNYIPLVFLEEGGKNRTPDKLPAAERQTLFAACDVALQETARVLQPKFVIGIGAFAQQRARAALADMPGIKFGTVLHPSPASPLANKGWAQRAALDFANAGIAL